MKYLDIINKLEESVIDILHTDPRTYINPIDETSWFFDEIFEIYKKIREVKEKVYDHERNRT